MAETKRKANSNPGAEENGSAPVKRQRVSRACDQCRSAREKCDGIQPACYTCVSSNRACSYTANPKKRGIQPGYIRTLELTLAWLFANAPGSEEKLKIALAQDSASQFLLSGRDVEGSYSLHKKWRKSVVCKEIERILSGSDNIERASSPALTENDADAEPSIPTNNPEKSLPTPSSVAFGKLPSNLTTSGMVRSATEYPEQPSLGVREETSKPMHHRSKLKLPQNMWRLLDVYFSFTHSWLPITEKHDILKISYSYPEDGLEVDVTKPGSGEHAELWSILALASVQERLAQGAELNAALAASEALQSSFVAGDFEDIYKAKHGQERPELNPSALYATARSLIPSEQGKHEWGHVRALLLLALINTGCWNLEAAWLLLGQAARIISLHPNLVSKSSDTSTFSGLRSEKGKHAYLACFALDTILSAHMRKEPYFRQEHAVRVGCVNEDGLEEWHPWTGCQGFGSGTTQSQMHLRKPGHSLSTFNQLIVLLGILNDKTVNVDQGSTDEQAILGRLHQWAAVLPSTFGDFGAGQMKSGSTPQSFNLHLAYLSTLTLCARNSDTSALAEQFCRVFRTYVDNFGQAGTPPIFRIYIDLLWERTSTDPLSSVSPSTYSTSARNELAILRSELMNYWSAWKLDGLPQDPQRQRNGPESALAAIPSPMYGMVDISMAGRANDGAGVMPQSNMFFSPELATHQGLGHMGSPFTQSGLRNIERNLPAPHIADTARSYSLNSAAEGLGSQSQLAQNVNTGMNTYFDNSLERYTSSGSVDLDALFDELASLEGTNRLDSQPQFMQNLGFAPDADLNDVLTPDYGGFDPLLSIFMQQSAGTVGGAPMLDQNQPFNPG